MTSTPMETNRTAREESAREVRGAVLVVDDDPLVARGYARVLGMASFAVEIATSGAEAIALLKTDGRARPIDAVVSDIMMPGMTGLELLRAIRELDLDLPVVLMTGAPNVDGAIRAIEYGAFNYLVKPIDTLTFVEIVSRAVRVREIAKLRREAIEVIHAGKHLGDRAGLEVRFAHALQTLWMAYQPIVSASGGGVFAYEALVRNEQPTLRNPLDLIDGAERLGLVQKLGRTIRASVASTLADAQLGDALIFVNLHADDLEDESLFSRDAPLSAHASRVVLEVTERAALEKVRDLMPRMRRLRALGYRIAVDDMGAGYAGLSSFAQLQPEVVKIDTSLVREIETSRMKQRLVRSLIELCQLFDIRFIAEGVETLEERDALVGLGGDLCQGFLFGRPGRAFLAAETAASLS